MRDMGAATDFLSRNPQLRRLRESETWQALKQRYKLHDDEPGLYVVRGDTIGEEDDLLVDALARGSAPKSPDALARRLFEELPPQLQDVVLRQLRNITLEGDQL